MSDDAFLALLAAEAIPVSKPRVTPAPHYTDNVVSLAERRRVRIAPRPIRLSTHDAA